MDHRPRCRHCRRRFIAESQGVVRRGIRFCGWACCKAYTFAGGGGLNEYMEIMVLARESGVTLVTDPFVADKTVDRIE